MKFYIHFWHGREKSLVEKIASFCEIDDDGNYFYNGTLEGFVEKYKDHFIYYPETLERRHPLIGVTQYPSFGQR